MLVVFIILFLISILSIGYIIVHKIPMVLATPREVVNDYVDESSSRLYVRFLRAGSWLKRGAYWGPVLEFLLGALKFIRVTLLKADKLLFNFSQFVDKKSEERKIAELEVKAPLDWDELKAPPASAEDIRK